MGILLCCSERKENSEKYKLNPENPGSKKQQFFPDFAFKLETIDHLINPSETLPVEPSQTYEEAIKLIIEKSTSYNLSPLYHIPSKVISDFEEVDLSEFDLNQSKDGIVLLNEELVRKQKSAVSHLLKQIGSNFLTGKSLMELSFPAEIFESQSVLERIANSLRISPLFLEKAGGLNEPLEQMKYAVGFLISQLHLNIGQKKPFNPILGETFQGTIDNKPICFEQISHHPPISFFHFVGDSFQINGRVELKASQSLNSAKGAQKGFPKITFKENNGVLYYHLPNALLKYLIWGKRQFSLSDYGFLINFDANLLCLIDFEAKKASSCDFDGHIYDISDCDELKSKIRKTIEQNEDLSIKLFDLNNMPPSISKISGNWLNYLKIDEILFWEKEKYPSFPLKRSPNLLPSDSLFRLDSLNLKIKDVKEAQEQKDKLEQLQRHDAKQRKKISSMEIKGS